ncbi:MAG: MgtC/SapB family protein [Clostridia bacterium]|nr:MgtC/SapB family protein [Clostridia bacterium]MBR5767604.1 MgtC/SapB family protein [Clostridia bacterium]
MMTLDKSILRLVFAFEGRGILLYVLLTGLIAGILASVIGLERQLQGEAAGIRTHALLAVGSSLLMTVSIWAIRMADGTIDIVHQTVSAGLNYDTSRIAAAVVTGIGFLGGGVIVKGKFTVRGLATASTLWISTALGLACGSGFILEAIVSIVVVLVILLVFGRILKYIDDHSPSVTMTADASYPVIERVRQFSEQNGYVLRTVDVLGIEDGVTTLRVAFGFKTPENLLLYFREQMLSVPEVGQVTVNGGKEKKHHAG